MQNLIAGFDQFSRAKAKPSLNICHFQRSLK